MKILLDSCSFLWIIQDHSNLSDKAKMLFTDSSNEVYLSSISTWEILLKNSLGRLDLPASPDKFIQKQRIAHGIQALALEEDAISHLLKLPHYHNDPFDRMLVCQAINHGLTILTPDKAIAQYPVLTVW